MVEQPGLLRGFTVLDLSSVGPASRATRILADYGASVVKVVPVPGAGPEPAAPPWWAYGAQRFTSRAAFDLRSAGGRDAFLALASSADVVVESFRPGVVDRLGIGYSAVSAVNPAIVYCSTSGYGQTGGRATWAGHDLDYLAVGGFLASSGRGAGGEPPIPGATVADAAGGGMHAAVAILAALVARASSGEGAYLDVSATDGVLWLMSLGIDEVLATGAAPGPGHDVLSGRYACYGLYEAADGRWLAVGAIEQKFFANLCEALGCPELADRQYDDGAQEEIRAAFRSAFSSKGRDEWANQLSGADTCVAPVLTAAEVAADPVLSSRGAFVEAKHADHGSFPQLAPLLAGMVRPAEPVEVPDPTGTRTAELLEAAGLSASEIGELLAEGSIA